MYESTDIDRNALLRGQDHHIADLITHKDTRFIVRFERRFLSSDPLGFLWPLAQLVLTVEQLDPIYLGRFRERECFALDLVEQPVQQDFLLFELRDAGLQVDDDERVLLFYAQGILNWHARHRFCGYCGSPVTTASAGHAKRCVNEDCAKSVYPKIDPAVIFSIENKKGPEPLLLLGRKPDWTPGRRSVIAGFVESGETLEAAVRREAYEETGVVVESVQYMASQPWPFPDALMCAFACQTSQLSIERIDGELEDARWFSAQDIRQGLSDGSLTMPYTKSVAWFLIDRWYRAQIGEGLDSI